MESKDFLGKMVNVKVDRPMGSMHPKFNYIYSVNYGYIPGTTSGDNEELDCYILGIDYSIDEFYGKCIAVIYRTNDNDDKLIVAPKNINYSNEEIDVITNFQEKYFEHIIIRWIWRKKLF